MRHGSICVHAWFVVRALSSLSFLLRFVSAGLPVCRGGTSRVIPTARIERQAEKKTRDNDEVGAIALPEVSAVLSYEYFYINPPLHTVRVHIVRSTDRRRSELKFRSAIVLRSRLSNPRSPIEKTLERNASSLFPRRSPP